MTIPAGTSVTLRVPASSANLGPGFDCVGLALGVWDECTVTVTAEPGLVIEVEGSGADSVPRDESHPLWADMDNDAISPSEFQRRWDQWYRSLLTP